MINCSYDMPISKCQCGNNFIPSGKDVCPPCYRESQSHRFTVRTELRTARKKAKQAQRASKKADKVKAKALKAYVN